MVAAIYVRALSAVSLKPNPNGLPGMPTAERLVNGFAAFVILACLLGALFGVAQWAIGSRSHQVGQASAGKQKIGIAIAGVFLVGALAAIINFALDAGETVRK
ncbi:MAG: hypothetical protein AB7T48_08410 [Solirubrobacterales bacterium]